MTSQCFLNLIYLLLQLLPLANLKPAPITGPYRSIITSIEDCATPSRPYMNNPPVICQLSIPDSPEKGSSLSGNITVLRNTKDIKIKMKRFIQRNGKWMPNYVMNNIDCHGVTMYMISAATRVKYDRKACMYLKGSYAFNDVDINQLQHIWTSNSEYGNLMWRAELQIAAGTIYCKEFNTVTKPASDILK